MLPKNKTQDIKGVGKIKPNDTIAYTNPYKSSIPKNNRSIPVIM